MNKKSVLLLLSGGKDSANCLKRLLDQDFSITALCISGRQKSEVGGAKYVAEQNGVELIVFSAFFFDETTWNPLKLIARDIAMGVILVVYCKRLKINLVATGVKDEDLNNPKLSWLSPFLRVSRFVLKLFAITLVHPLLEDKVLKAQKSS